MTVNSAFLFSPPYSEPITSTIFFSKLIKMAVSLLVPSVAGSAFMRGRQMSVNSGTKPLSSSFLGSMNIFLTNRFVHAHSVMARTFRREASLEPT